MTKYIDKLTLIIIEDIHYYKVNKITRTLKKVCMATELFYLCRLNFLANGMNERYFSQHPLRKL